MHAQALGFVRRSLDCLPLRGRVVELGSRDVNGSIRPCFPHAASYTGVDLVDGPCVDVVADGATYQPEQQADVVVCCETLEHTPDGEQIVANAARMLAPGGWLLVTCATAPRDPHSAVDGGPLQSGEFYANVAPAALWDWARTAGLELVQREADYTVGDLRLLARRTS